jgi:hypothetical protein
MRNREKLLETNISRLFSPVSYRESYIDIILKFTFRPSRIDDYTVWCCGGILVFETRNTLCASSRHSLPHPFTKPISKVESTSSNYRLQAKTGTIYKRGRGYPLLYCSISICRESAKKEEMDVLHPALGIRN